ncbi:unnamed protein product [Natator depressus]
MAACVHHTTYVLDLSALVIILSQMERVSSVPLNFLYLLHLAGCVSVLGVCICTASSKSILLEPPLCASSVITPKAYNHDHFFHVGMCFAKFLCVMWHVDSSSPAPSMVSSSWQKGSPPPCIT